MREAEHRLSELGLQPPEVPPTVANGLNFLLASDQLLISGQIARDAADRVLTGFLGGGVTIEDGQTATRQAALALLAQARTALGYLDRIVKVLRLTGFVTAARNFVDRPKVGSGASDLLVAMLGDAGRHPRSVVGVAGLPMGASVELDAILKAR